MKTILPVITAILTCTVALAQQAPHAPRAPRILEEKPGLHVVLDNDGGRVETYVRGEVARELEYHGGSVINAPLVHLIFLGDWSSYAAQRDALARNAARLSSAIDERQLESAGVRRALNFTGATNLFAAARVNDLDVQRALASALHDGSLAQRDENVIYVVFLAPGTKSTLGDHIGASDYDSYHSHVHAEDLDVRYVVVPYRDDTSAITSAAAKSLQRAIVNPNGDGWY